MCVFSPTVVSSWTAVGGKDMNILLLLKNPHGKHCLNNLAIAAGAGAVVLSVSYSSFPKGTRPHNYYMSWNGKWDVWISQFLLPLIFFSFVSPNKNNSPAEWFTQTGLHSNTHIMYSLESNLAQILVVVDVLSITLLLRVGHVSGGIMMTEIILFAYIKGF